MNNPPATVLHSQGLLSKWGFGDGDALDWLRDYGIEDDGAVLCEVVRRKLIPALHQKVEVTEIGTCHNPIRAVSVDGKDATGLWYDIARPSLLSPESITVTGEEVLAIAKEVQEAKR